MAGIPGQGTGNKNAAGNKGGGRKSAYQEQADAEFWLEMFLEPVEKSVIAKRLATGKYSVKDVMLSKALAGNDRLIEAMYKKLVPDKLDLQGNLQQKTSAVLEGNLRNLLEMSVTVGKQSTKLTTVKRTDNTKSVEEALLSLKNKGKVKGKLKVKKLS